MIGVDVDEIESSVVESLASVGRQCMVNDNLPGCDLGGKPLLHTTHKAGMVAGRVPSVDEMQDAGSNQFEQLITEFPAINPQFSNVPPVPELEEHCAAIEHDTTVADVAFPQSHLGKARHSSRSTVEKEPSVATAERTSDRRRHNCSYKLPHSPNPFRSIPSA